MDVKIKINDPILIGAEYFLVRYRENPGGPWINLANQTNDEFIIPDLSPGDYTLSVRYVNAQGIVCPEVLRDFDIEGCDEELIPATVDISGLFSRFDVNYGIHGAFIYEPGYLVDGTAVLQHSMTNAFWKGRINQVAVWPTAGGGPLNVWVGFNFCVNVEETKTYYLAIAADNRFRINIDGSDVLMIDDTPSNVTVYNTTTFQDQLLNREEAFGFRMGIIPGPYSNGQILELSAVLYKAYHIFPVQLSAGAHKIRILALNWAGPGGMACDIFDNTVEELVAATAIGDLDVVFTTGDQTQFEDGNYSCPPGYVLVGGEGCDAPMCKFFCGPPDTCECVYIQELYAMRMCNNTSVIYMRFDKTDMGVCEYRITYTEFGGINPQTVSYGFGQLPDSLTITIPFSNSSNGPRVRVEHLCCNGDLITCFDEKIIDLRRQECAPPIGI